MTSKNDNASDSPPADAAELPICAGGANMNRRDPMEGITLAMMLEELVAAHGFELIGRELGIKGFLHNPTMNSCLKLLRRTPWARKLVEDMYRDHRIELLDEHFKS